MCGSGDARGRSVGGCEFFFFFQAEDGIRDRLVTGVQTCALPICLTGYRVGAVIAGEGLLREITKAADCVAICAPAIGQRAALYGIENLSQWRRDKRGLMADRLEALRLAFRRNDLDYELVSSGAYFAYLRHPFGDQQSADVARRLPDDHNVLCMPGGMFGPDQEPYLRFAFANLEAELMPALAERLVESQG